MANELLIAITAGLGGMLGWGFADFFAKKTVDRIGDYSTLFWSQSIGGFLLFLYLLFSQNIHSMTAFDFFALVGLGIIDAVSWIYFYKALEKGEVSILSPIFASWAAVSVIISVLIFGEYISHPHWILLSIVFVGVVLTSLDLRVFSKKTEAKIISGLPEVIIATILFSFWVALWGHFSNSKPWIFYTLIMRIVVIAILFFACKYKKISLIVKDRSTWKFLFLIGASELLAYSLVSYGFSNTTHVSIVAMLSGAFSLPTIILARIFLKEKMTKLQIAGSAIIITGIVFLSIQ